MSPLPRVRAGCCFTAIELEFNLLSWLTMSPEARTLTFIIYFWTDVSQVVLPRALDPGPGLPLSLAVKISMHAGILFLSFGIFPECFDSLINIRTIAMPHRS